MSAVPGAHAGLGALELEETFFYHDGPRLFSAVNRSGHRYLGLSVDEDESRGIEIFLYVPVSEHRWGQVRSGAVDLRTAVLEAEDGVVAIVEVAPPAVDPSGLTFRPSRTIPGGWLPEAGFRLTLETMTRPAFVEEDFVRQAASQLRTVLALELKPPGLSRTEYPLRSFTRIGRTLQDLVDAFAQEEAGIPTERGAIPASVLDQSELAFVESRAASFVWILAARNADQIPGAGVGWGALLRVAELIETRPGEELADRLRGYGRRAVSKYRAFLESLSDDETDVRFVVASPREHRSSTLPLGGIREALAVIKDADTEIREVRLRGARLIGVNLRTRYFELLDPKGNKKYSGRAEPSAVVMLEGLPTGQGHAYDAVLLEEPEYSNVTDEVRVTYRLVEIAVGSTV